jgi:NTE family protein
MENVAWTKEGLNASQDRRPQIVLVLQGGGALGSYQAGVYQALHEADINPDWIIGTSIGAINACLIAGNPAETRLASLRAFWNSVQLRNHWLHTGYDEVDSVLNFWSASMGGVPSFFKPNVLALWNSNLPLKPDEAGYYSAAPLRSTLLRLADFNLINRAGPRVTVGAANVKTGAMHYFDSRADTISVDHILASGALPPAFPPVRIDGELYWDGGILSNSPTEIVFEDNPRKDALIFSVNMWNPKGKEPSSMADVLQRQKDIQYASRIASHILRQKHTHKLRHIISELRSLIPEGAQSSEYAKELLSYGCVTRMHVVQLLAPQHMSDTVSKDVDFTATGICRRWESGYQHTIEMLDRQPWLDAFDPLDGVILHERDAQ